MPVSIKDVVLAGVGDARTGKFISGHQSRQEAASLQQIAIRLRGTYHDGNAHQLPSELLRKITALPEESVFEKLTRREYALAALGFGAFIFAILPWLLLRFGSAWQPGVRISKPVTVQSNTITI
jgi:Ca-activated chloride channel homolog